MSRPFESTVVNHTEKRSQGAQVSTAVPLILRQSDTKRVHNIYSNSVARVVYGCSQLHSIAART